ncbi:hypothetical protein YC2023_002999 [Brassica napus]
MMLERAGQGCKDLPWVDGRSWFGSLISSGWSGTIPFDLRNSVVFGQFDENPGKAYGSDSDKAVRVVDCISQLQLEFSSNRFLPSTHLDQNMRLEPEWPARVCLYLMARWLGTIGSAKSGPDPKLSSKKFGPRGLSVQYTRTSVCVRQHTQDVRGRPAVHQYTYQHAPWTVRVILAHVGCLFSTHRTSVSTRRTSVAVRVCPCVRQCTQDVRQHTQDVRQHTQDVRGCPCVSVCPSVHTGRPSAHTGRPSAHAGRPSAHAGRPWLSVCVRVSVSAHRTSVSTHRTSVSTRRTSVAVRVCPCVRQHTQDVRQHTQDVRAYPLAHTDCPWTDPCTELISAC